MNTDWVNASGMLLLFAICVFLSSHGIWRLLHGRIHSLNTSWINIFAALFLVYVGLGTKLKELKIPCLLLAFGPLSRALLRTLKAPVDFQIMNSIFVGWIDVAISIAVACYVVSWFKRKAIFLNSKAPDPVTNDPRP
jgi:hypothetical protein